MSKQVNKEVDEYVYRHDYHKEALADELVHGYSEFKHDLLAKERIDIRVLASYKVKPCGGVYTAYYSMFAPQNVTEHEMVRAASKWGLGLWAAVSRQLRELVAVNWEQCVREWGY